MGHRNMVYSLRKISQMRTERKNLNKRWTTAYVRITARLGKERVPRYRRGQLFKEIFVPPRSGIAWKSWDRAASLIGRSRGAEQRNWNQRQEKA